MSKLNKFGLPDITIAYINGVFAKFPAVEKALLYGSRAKGNYRHGSDIDLTLIGEELTNDDLNAMCIELDDLPIPYTIDLSLFTQLDHDDLKEHIQKVGKVFYCK